MNLEKHDCSIGVLDLWDSRPLVTLADLKKHIERQKEYNAYLIDTGSPGFLYTKVWELTDYGDWRKNTDLTRFSYCPECGNKIDWKKIRRC